MKEIKKISQQIDAELEDAEKYLKCAYKYKDTNSILANMYYDLSVAEMNHVTILHDASVKLISEYKGQIPEGMQSLYEYLHERHMKWARKIMTKQEQYKAV